MKRSSKKIEQLEFQEIEFDSLSLASFFRAVRPAFIMGNQYVFQIIIQQQSLTKWPKSNSLWMDTLRILAIYPEESSNFNTYVQKYNDLKFSGTISKHFRYLTKRVINSRRRHLSDDLRTRLSKIDDKIQVCRNLLSVYWSAIAHGSSTSTYRLAQTIRPQLQEIENEYVHLSMIYPNNAYICQKFSNYLSEIISDPKRAAIWKHQMRNIRQNKNKTQSPLQNAFKLFPHLPPKFRNYHSENPNVSTSLDKSDQLTFRNTDHISGIFSSVDDTDFSVNSIQNLIGGVENFDIRPSLIRERSANISLPHFIHVRALILLYLTICILVSTLTFFLINRFVVNRFIGKFKIIEYVCAIGVLSQISSSLIITDMTSYYGGFYTYSQQLALLGIQDTYIDSDDYHSKIVTSVSNYLSYFERYTDAISQSIVRNKNCQSFLDDTVIDFSLVSNNLNISILHVVPRELLAYFASLISSYRPSDDHCNSGCTWYNELLLNHNLIPYAAFSFGQVLKSDISPSLSNDLSINLIVSIVFTLSGVILFIYTLYSFRSIFTSWNHLIFQISQMSPIAFQKLMNKFSSKAGFRTGVNMLPSLENTANGTKSKATQGNGLTDKKISHEDSSTEINQILSNDFENQALFRKIIAEGQSYGHLSPYTSFVIFLIIPFILITFTNFTGFITLSQFVVPFKILPQRLLSSIKIVYELFNLQQLLVRQYALLNGTLSTLQIVQDTNSSLKASIEQSLNNFEQSLITFIQGTSELNFKDALTNPDEANLFALNFTLFSEDGNDNNRVLNNDDYTTLTKIPAIPDGFLIVQQYASLMMVLQESVSSFQAKKKTAALLTHTIDNLFLKRFYNNYFPFYDKQVLKETNRYCNCLNYLSFTIIIFGLIVLLVLMIYIFNLQENERFIMSSLSMIDPDFITKQSTLNSIFGIQTDANQKSALLPAITSSENLIKEGIIIIGPDLKVKSINVSALELFGWKNYSKQSDESKSSTTTEQNLNSISASRSHSKYLDSIPNYPTSIFSQTGSDTFSFPNSHFLSDQENSDLSKSSSNEYQIRFLKRFSDQNIFLSVEHILLKSNDPSMVVQTEFDTTLTYNTIDSPLIEKKEPIPVHVSLKIFNPESEKKNLSRNQNPSNNIIILILPQNKKQKLEADCNRINGKIEQLKDIVIPNVFRSRFSQDSDSFFANNIFIVLFHLSELNQLFSSYSSDISHRIFLRVENIISKHISSSKYGSEVHSFGNCFCTCFNLSNSTTLLANVSNEIISISKNINQELLSLGIGLTVVSAFSSQVEFRLIGEKIKLELRIYAPIMKNILSKLRNSRSGIILIEKEMKNIMQKNQVLLPKSVAENDSHPFYAFSLCE